MVYPLLSVPGSVVYSLLCVPGSVPGAVVYPLLSEIRPAVRRGSSPASADLRSSPHVRGVVHGSDVDDLADRHHRVHPLHGGLLAVPRSSFSQHQQSSATDLGRHRPLCHIQSTQVRLNLPSEDYNNNNNDKTTTTTTTTTIIYQLLITFLFYVFYCIAVYFV